MKYHFWEENGVVPIPRRLLLEECFCVETKSYSEVRYKIPNESYTDEAGYNIDRWEVFIIINSVIIQKYIEETISSPYKI